MVYSQSAKNHIRTQGTAISLRSWIEGATYPLGQRRYLAIDVPTMLFSIGNMDTSWWAVAKSWMQRKIFPLLSIHHNMYVVLCVDRRLDDQRPNFSRQPRVYVGYQRQDYHDVMQAKVVIQPKSLYYLPSDLKTYTPNDSIKTIEKQKLHATDHRSLHYRHLIPQLCEAISQSLGEAIDEYLGDQVAHGTWTFVLDNWVPDVYKSMQHVYNLQTGNMMHISVPPVEDVWIQKPERVYEGDLMIAEWAHLWATLSDAPITLSSVDGDVWLVSAGFLVTCARRYKGDVHVIHLPGGDTAAVIRSGRDHYNPLEKGDGFDVVRSEEVSKDESSIIIRDLRAMQTLINGSMMKTYQWRETSAAWLDTFDGKDDAYTNTMDWFIEYFALLAFHENDYIPKQHKLRFLPPVYTSFLPGQVPMPPVVFRHPRNPDRFMVNFRGLLNLAILATEQSPKSTIKWSTSELFWLHRNMEFVLHYFILDPKKVQTNMTVLDSEEVPLYGFYRSTLAEPTEYTIVSMYNQVHLMV